jgi:hypothetical protein
MSGGHPFPGRAPPTAGLLNLAELIEWPLVCLSLLGASSQIRGGRGLAMAG